MRSAPLSEQYQIYARVKTTIGRRGFHMLSGAATDNRVFFRKSRRSVRIFQDTLEIKSGAPATGFRIKVEAQGNASVCDLYGLHVYINRNVFWLQLPLIRRCLRFASMSEGFRKCRSNIPEPILFVRPHRQRPPFPIFSKAIQSIPMHLQAGQGSSVRYFRQLDSQRCRSLFLARSDWQLLG